MDTKITRRAMAAVLGVPALVAPALAAPPQSPAAPQNSPAAPQNSPDDELKAARDQNRQNAEQLAKFPLKMAIEPATHFRA